MALGLIHEEKRVLLPFENHRISTIIGNIYTTERTEPQEGNRECERAKLLWEYVLLLRSHQFR